MIELLSSPIYWSIMLYAGSGLASYIITINIIKDYPQDVTDLLGMLIISMIASPLLILLMVSAVLEK